jgi:hypothetical protein
LISETGFRRAGLPGVMVIFSSPGTKSLSPLARIGARDLDVCFEGSSDRPAALGGCGCDDLRVTGFGLTTGLGDALERGGSLGSGFEGEFRDRPPECGRDSAMMRRLSVGVPGVDDDSTFAGDLLWSSAD